MNEAAVNFDQWREDAKFLCDQYGHAMSRRDFYAMAVERENKTDLAPQLERWKGLASNLINALLKHYLRGQRWQIDGNKMLELYKNSLQPKDYVILMLADFDSPESQLV